MNKRTWLIIGCIAGIISILFFIYFQQGFSKKSDTYKVGAIVFLTGAQASLGTEVKNALTIATDELNENGGINGKRIEVVYEDSKDSPRDAIMAFNRLVTEKVPVVISTGDVVSLNLASIVGEKKIPMIATVAAGPDITKKNDYVFRAFLQTGPPAEMIAAYARQKLNIKSVAILSINNEFGMASYRAFKDTFENLGGTISGFEVYGISDRDIRAQITKLKDSEPEAIFVGGFGEGYGACIKQIRELRFPGLILTTNSLSIPYFQQQTRPASEGAHFTSTLYDENYQSPAAINFTTSYRKKFNSDPSYIGAFAYDSLKLIAIAIERGGYTSEGIKHALLSINNHEGVVGTMSFDNQGELNYPLVIKKIENGKAIIVSDK